jgi:hypothetical protein
LKKYRRIEVNAYRRRVTVVSGEWPREIFEAQAEQTDDEVSLNDTDVCEPVASDSPEGQLILIEAVRSLERRLSPEARATIRETSKGAHANPEELNPVIEKGP